MTVCVRVHVEERALRLPGDEKTCQIRAVRRFQIIRDTRLQIAYLLYCESPPGERSMPHGEEVPRPQRSRRPFDQAANDPKRAVPTRRRCDAGWAQQISPDSGPRLNRQGRTPTQAIGKPISVTIGASLTGGQRNDQERVWALS